jgi:hypothetical protein
MEDNMKRVQNLLNVFRNILWNQQAIFNQTWHKSFLGKGNLQFAIAQINGQVLFKEEIITNMQKYGGVI